MATTFQNLLDRAEEAATNIAGDASVSPLIDSEVTAEVIYPHAVRSVFRDYAKTGRHLDDINRDHSITLTNGEATLPETIFREFLDQAYIVGEQFASKVPYEDYLRYRYDNQMCYFAIRNGKIYYSCDPQTLLRQREISAFGAAFFAFGLDSADLTPTDAGRRVKVTSADLQTLYFDGFIVDVNSYAVAQMGGLSLDSFPAGVSTLPANIYDSSGYTTDRSLTSVETSTGSDVVTCAGGAFTEADTGKRLRVMLTGEVVIDAIIAHVNSATEVRMAAFALNTTSVATATVESVPLVINAPGIPTAPTAGSDVLTFAPAIIDDIVMKIASVLRGELKLNALIGNNDVRK